MLRPTLSGGGVGSTLATRLPNGVPTVVVLQVDAAVSRCHGLAWLVAQRETGILGRLAELNALSRDEGWSAADLTQARLSVLRPRRAEMNRLSLAYLHELAPGVIDAAHRIRRAGIVVELASEVAIESLFGVATALGVTPSGLRGPTLRFDALGAYRGCEVRPVVESRERGYTLGVGTASSDLARVSPADSFVVFTGFVESGDRLAPRVPTASSFGELASWLAA